MVALMVVNVPKSAGQIGIPLATRNPSSMLNASNIECRESRLKMELSCRVMAER
jgi:hypothetical protein